MNTSRIHLAAAIRYQRRNRRHLLKTEGKGKYNFLCCVYALRSFGFKVNNADQYKNAAIAMGGKA